MEKFLETLTDNGIEIKRLYIGGSYVSLKPEPQDIDILVCWKPNQKVTNNKQLSEFIDKRATIFDQSLIESKFQIQAHFQCLLGATDTTIHMVGKWIFINSYHRESGIHRGIVCFENLDVTKLIKGENYV
ncbi:MAG: hypothetical protein SVW51_13275 [Pseudomonadota bacterium]|nr:hypothetical protein [Pseudomonadota bacterium]